MEHILDMYTTKERAEIDPESEGERRKQRGED